MRFKNINPESVGIIVGCLGVVVSAIGAYYSWKAIRK